MASDKLKLYNAYSKNEADDIINLSTDTFKVALFSAASNCATLTHSVLADLTNELPTANGYTSGGLTLANKSITESAGVTKITFDDAQWTAAGGPIAARFAVIYDNTHASKPLVGSILLDNTPADLVAADTQQFIIQWHANGAWTKFAANT